MRARLNLLEERLRGEMAGGREQGKGAKKEQEGDSRGYLKEVEVEGRSGLKEQESRKEGQEALLLCPGEEGGKHDR